jgi:PAS domain S-box-containing protein
MQVTARVGEAEAFRQLVDRSPAISLIVDAQQRLVYANPAFLDAVGLSRLQARLAPLAEYVHVGPGDGAPPEQASRTLCVTCRLRSPADPGAASRRFSGLCFDVADLGGESMTGMVMLDEARQDPPPESTERSEGAERAERAEGAEHDRSWYRILFQLASVPMIRAQGGDRIEDANPTACQLVGYPLSELRGRPLADLFVPGSGPGAGAGWHELLAGRRTRHAGEGLIVRKDRRLISVRITGWTDHAPPDAPAQAICVVYPRLPSRGRWLELPGGFRLPAIAALVLEGLAADLNNAEIGARLGLSRQGVDYHLALLRRRLRVTSRSALVARAYALGVLHPGTWPPAVDHRFLEPHPKPPPAVSGRLRQRRP